MFASPPSIREHIREGDISIFFFTAPYLSSAHIRHIFSCLHNKDVPSGANAGKFVSPQKHPQETVYESLLLCYTKDEKAPEGLVTYSSGMEIWQGGNFVAHVECFRLFAS